MQAGQGSDCKVKKEQSLSKPNHGKDPNGSRSHIRKSNICSSYNPLFTPSQILNTVENPPKVISEGIVNRSRQMLTRGEPELRMRVGQKVDEEGLSCQNTLRGKKFEAVNSTPIPR